MPLKLHTPRLDLLNCDLGLVQHVLQGNAALAAATGLTVPHDWTEFGAPIFQFTAERLREFPADAPWWTWLPVIRAENVLIGSCGFKGRPTATGEVEIGYEIAASRRQQGFATELAHALVGHAFAQQEVALVSAHTLAEENPSTKVLQRCGFVKVAALDDPEDGPIWRWELPRTTFATTC